MTPDFYTAVGIVVTIISTVVLATWKLQSATRAIVAYEIEKALAAHEKSENAWQAGMMRRLDDLKGFIVSGYDPRHERTGTGSHDIPR